jgi:hypothetical protein
MVDQISEQDKKKKQLTPFTQRWPSWLKYVGKKILDVN